MGDRASAPRLGIATPASWVHLDLDPQTRAASIRRLVEERVQAMPEAAPFAAELVTALEGTVAAAEQQGGVFAAVFSTVSDGRPVGASVVVSLAQGSGAVAGDADADARKALAEELRERYAGEDADAAVVELPPGPAARVRRRVRAELPASSGEPAVGAEVAQVQYFIPLPGATHLAVLSFSTPNLGLIEPFDELFEAIAGTLTWT